MALLLLHLIALRIVNVFLVKTSFVPDEYWQALEVAHHSAFGYGSLTWEWTYGLRSYLYPSIFAAVYRLLASFNADFPEMLIYAPRIIQAILSGFGDWCFYKFAKEHFGVGVAKFSLFSLLCNWFWWYCASRTIINTLECSALCIGLLCYPWKRGCENGRKVVFFQILSITITIIRPTAAVVWIPLAFWHIIRAKCLETFLRYTILSVIILVFSGLVDYIFYQRSVFVLWNFFTFNFVKNLGVHYGSHPWHWYVTQGIPAVFGSHILVFIYGLLIYSKILNNSRQRRVCTCLLVVFFITCLAYSFVGHKEFRFILHLVPVGSLFGGIAMVNMSQMWRRYAVTFLVVTNIPVALYTGLIHQGGSLKIMKSLDEQLRLSCTNDCPGHVLFLMPCHTTPMYSHFHVNVSVRYIECLPNLEEKLNYLDECDVFYASPISWLDGNVFHSEVQEPVNYEWILIFDTLLSQLNGYEPIKDYEICAKSFHTHVPESRTGQYIYLLCKLED